MVTTGIGRDIMPVTPLEHTFSTVMIVVGVFMYAFIIGSASNSLANWDAGTLMFFTFLGLVWFHFIEKAERRQKLENINQYLRQRNISVSLQKRIRAFYDYMWSSNQSIRAKQGLLGDLHMTLALELHISLNRKIVENVPIFKVMKESECVIDMIEKLQPKIYIPGEYLCLQGELGSEMYIIVRGSVCVLVQNRGGSTIKQINTVSDGGVVGETALLYRSRRRASIRAATYCDVLILSKPDFDTVLKRYPEFRANMHRLATLRAKGWERVRSVLRMAKAVNFFGTGTKISDLLLTKLEPEEKDEKEPVLNEKKMEHSLLSFKRKKRYSFALPQG